MALKKYTFSFTAASALIKETFTICELYVKYKDWNKVEEEVFDHNILNKKKGSTVQREFNEIKKRLVNLNALEMNLLIKGDSDSTKIIVRLALVKTYVFLFDFLREVVTAKFLQYDNYISDADYYRFIDSKTALHPELGSSSETTLKKVKQVTFRMLAEVGIISSVKEKQIIKGYIPPSCLDIIYISDPMLLSAYFYSDQEIRTFKTQLQA
jgi:hypothetical protein